MDSKNESKYIVLSFILAGIRKSVPIEPKNKSKTSKQVMKFMILFSQIIGFLFMKVEILPYTQCVLKIGEMKGEKILVIHNTYVAEFQEQYGNDWVRKLITEEK